MSEERLYKAIEDLLANLHSAYSNLETIRIECKRLFPDEFSTKLSLPPKTNLAKDLEHVESLVRNAIYEVDSILHSLNELKQVAEKGER